MDTENTQEVTTNEETTEKTEQEQITMTKEELDKLLQQEGDKRVSTARQKIISDYEAKAREKEEEAKRLAQLSAEERAMEIQKQKDEEVAKLKAELNRRDLETDTISRLNDEGIDIQFKEFLMADDVDTTNERIKLFKAKYQQAIQEEVEQRLKGNTPKIQANIPKTKTNKVDVQNYAEKKRIIK